MLGKPDATEEQMWAALEASRIAELVWSLPDQLETIVGARGHRFSGGEQQRIAIARTLLRDPRILVSDEATRALDNATEAEVQKALESLADGRTILTIAHRLSTVETADQIIVLENGRIVERGRAMELRDNNGLFSRLSLAV